MKIIKNAGRDKSKRLLVLCLCDCGAEFTTRRDYAKAGRVKRCPGCRGVAAPAPPAPATPISPTASPATPPEVEAMRGSALWLRNEIERKTATAIKMEQEAADFELLMTADGVQSQSNGEDPPDRLWARATKTAKQLRAEINLLKRELATQEKQATQVDPRQANRERIAQLKGMRQ